MNKLVIAFVLALAASCITAAAYATTVTASPSDYRAKLAALQAGDILDLQAGRYTDRLPVDGLAGTANAPITIRGPASGAKAVFEGDNNNNVVRLLGSSYITLQNLEIDGMGRWGFGVASEAGGACSHHITIENFYIHDLIDATDMVGSQQIVAISTSGCPAWNWTIRGNLIERVGTGMYLGNSDGNQQFFAGLIEYNVIRDTIGYNAEFKQQNTRPVISGMPTQDARTIIRHNVFSKGANSSTGGNVRPNLLVGHMPLSGTGMNDRYEIYGNFFYQNPSESLFQGEGNIYFYDNVMFNSYGTAVAIQAHNDKPRDVHLFNNTIVAAGNGISISGGQAGYVQEAFANAVFAATPVSAANARSNLTGNMATAATYLNNTSATIGQLDLFPKSSAVVGATVDYSTLVPTSTTLGTISDVLRDFNGATQPGTMRGAYVYAGSNVNPGWALALTRKGAPTTSVPAPTLTFNADHTSVAQGGVAVLTWASDADSCTASGGWTGAKTASGSQQVGPLTAATSFSLLCTNAGGQISATVAVAVMIPPVVTFSASPTTVSSGGVTTLSWTATSAQTCNASGAWSGGKSLGPASEQSSALTANSSFTLSCQGVGGTTARTVAVAITTGGSSSSASSSSSSAASSASSSSSGASSAAVTSAGDSGSGGGAFSISQIICMTLLWGIRQKVAVRNNSFSSVI